MPARLAPLSLAILAAILAACGGGEGDPAATSAPPSEEESPTADADPAAVEVIDAWAMALAEGDVDAAARFFAIPSVAQNGPTLRITSRAEARLFNATLPCGAELTGAETEGEFTIATFELTERPGRGICGSGTGAKAQTAFVIEDGEIVEWRRVGVGGLPPAPGEAA